MTGVRTIDAREVLDLDEVFDEDDARDSSTVEIECPECLVFYPGHMWTAYQTDCESCGSHPVLKCPNKDTYHYFDPYGDNPDMNVRPYAGS